MSRRLLNKVKKLIIICAGLTVFYNEIFCYFYASLFWPVLSLGTEDDTLQILFVADPQIVGYNDEAVLRPISRRDCDRYLRKTFLYALDHVDPDVIVFLGDILDEGSTAPDEEYEIYVERFNDIFHTSKDIPKLIIPGDNDVGGEGLDIKEKWKIDRFNDHFVIPFQHSLLQKEQNSDSVSLRFLDLIPMNIDSQDDINASLLQKLSKKQGKYRFAFNHMGIIDRYDISKIMQTVAPDFIFTAHWHKARLHVCTNCREPRENSEKWQHMWHGKRIEMYPGNSPEKSVYTFDFSQRMSSVCEISVPTCSYRMGVKDMGYGAAIVSRSGLMRYTVLWLPSRYFCLTLYGIMAGVIVSFFTINFLCNLRVYSPLPYNRQK